MWAVVANEHVALENLLDTPAIQLLSPSPAVGTTDTLELAFAAEVAVADSCSPAPSFEFAHRILLQIDSRACTLYQGRYGVPRVHDNSASRAYQRQE